MKQDRQKNHFAAVHSQWLVDDKQTFKVRHARTAPHAPDRNDNANGSALEHSVKRLQDLQRVLYAANRRSVLLIFQAMDAGGKDSTIRAVLTGVNPAGCAVTSFKKPTLNELDHDFLWRSACSLPRRGEIGVFNRSHYEEVLAVKVHPEFLDGQRLPSGAAGAKFWRHRYQSIRDHEKHLARNGTVVCKFWLNVSLAEQRKRFLSRLDEPDKNWKFEAADLDERALWPQYMQAFEETLNETSRPWAPWYAIPADDKPYMSATVADIVVRTLESLDLEYPEPREDQTKRFEDLRARLRKP